MISRFSVLAAAQAMAAREEAENRMPAVATGGRLIVRGYVIEPDEEPLLQALSPDLLRASAISRAGPAAARPAT